MIIYIAYHRYRFDVDIILGVFNTYIGAESAIGEHLVKVKFDRQFEDDDTMLFQLGGTFEVDTWAVDSKERLENIVLSNERLKELVKEVES